MRVKLNNYTFSVVLTLLSCSTDNDPDVALQDPPQSQAPSDVSGTSFTAKWSSVSGAKYYLLDVSTNVEFTSPVNGFSNLKVTGTSHVVTGLNASEKYFYRVKAGNNAGETLSSKVVAVRKVNKSLLYDFVWQGNEAKSQVTFVFMDLKFGKTGTFTGTFGPMVTSIGTWAWKGDSDTIQITSSTGNCDITFLDIGRNYFVSY